MDFICGGSVVFVVFVGLGLVVWVDYDGVVYVLCGGCGVEVVVIWFCYGWVLGFVCVVCVEYFGIVVCMCCFD